jgi:hypothetical protein
MASANNKDREKRKGRRRMKKFEPITMVEKRKTEGKKLQ